ncbi:MAG: methyltransferase domain-containing protein [Anaerolineales bacterium]|nr:methyltransferase domain-containing protein [Anaerolineales bacterium]
MPRARRLVHTLAGLLLFPVYWLLAFATSAPGLVLRLRFARKGFVLLTKRDYVRAYGLLVAPLDSFRYFEFDFMWHAVKHLRPSAYLDVSSPRMLPLLIVDRNKTLVADLINPDKSDLPETRSLAKTLKLSSRCRFHDSLIGDAPLKPESFDLITSMSVIEHIQDDAGAIRKMWDLLRPGGVLLLSVPCAARASEEHINLNDYGLMGADDQGFVFWQRYYDDSLLQQRIFSITGQPRRSRIYAENKAGNYSRNVEQKRANPYYPYWREPFMIGQEYAFQQRLCDLPGMAVIAMEFVKPE